MSTIQDASYIGRGEIFMRLYGTSEPLMSVGNCSALGIQHEINQLKLADNTTSGGGTANTVDRVTAARLSIAAHDFNAKNLGIATNGEVSVSLALAAVSHDQLGVKKSDVFTLPTLPKAGETLTITAGANTLVENTDYTISGAEITIDANANHIVTAGTDLTISYSTEQRAETHKAYKGGLIKLNQLPDTATAMTVKKGSTELVLNTDYSVNGAGLFILADTTAIADGDDVTVTYTAQDADVIEALVNSGKNYQLLFVGLNEAQSDAPVVIDVHKFKPSASADMALIGDDFAALEIGGEALSDATVAGNGLSKFYRVTKTQQ